MAKKPDPVAHAAHAVVTDVLGYLERNSFAFRNFIEAANPRLVFPDDIEGAERVDNELCRLESATVQAVADDLRTFLVPLLKERVELTADA